MSVHKDLHTGKYFVRYRHAGKQYKKSGFQTKREAQAFEQEQLRAVRSGVWNDPKAALLTVADLFEDWIVAVQIEERTRHDYRATFRNQIAPQWGRIKVKDVSPTGVQRWASQLASRYSRSTVNQAVTVLNQLMRWAVADNRITINPVERAKALAGKSLVPRAGVSKEKRVLSHAEVQLLASCAGDSSLLILFMAYTGVRFGEVSALQVRDIDLLRNRVLLRRAFSDINGELFEVPPKSGQAREIPIPELLRKPLRHHIEQSQGGPQGLLFPSPEGRPLRYNNWRSRVLAPAAKAAGIKGMTTHTFRHTYASLSIQAKVTPRTLQEAMGHADIRLTLNTYGHLYPSDLDAMGDALSAAASAATLTTDVPEMFPMLQSRAN